MPKKQPLPPTERQLELLQIVAAGWQSHSPPTVREIAEAMAIRSPNGVACHADALIKKGLLAKSKRGARLLYLTEAGEQVLDRLRGVC